MKRLLGLLILLSGVAAAQTVAAPDCGPIAFNLTANGDAPSAAGYDNRQTQCVTWTLAYEVAGLTGYTVAFQSSVGANSATSFGAYTGNTIASSASFGTASLGIATYNNIDTSGTTVNTPWVRVAVTGAMGSGIIRGVLYGYRTGPTGGTGGGGGGSGGTGCPNPCPVEGTAASGSPPSGPPVLSAGSDGSNVRTIATTSTGNPLVEFPVPQGVYMEGLGTLLNGQQAVTGTAAALPSNTTKFVCVRALIANTINVYVGTTTVTTSGSTGGFELPPGQGQCFQVGNSNQLYVIASTTGASVSWEGLN